jgi:hypothetical protein
MILMGDKSTRRAISEKPFKSTHPSDSDISIHLCNLARICPDSIREIVERADTWTAAPPDTVDVW